jgi:hypothetical protein
MKENKRETMESQIIRCNRQSYSLGCGPNLHSLLFFAVKTTPIMKGDVNMVYFKPTCLMTKEEKQKVSEMDGKIMLWILERRSVLYMAQQLNMEPYQVEHNINEMLYNLKIQVGKKRYIKTLFIK